MNQEDPRSDLFFFFGGKPKPHPATIPLEYQRLTPHLSKKKIKYPTPVKHPQSQKIPHTCQTFVISKKYPTPNKHSWSQKNTPHLTNILDLKKNTHT